MALEMYREAPERFSGLVLINTTSTPAGTAEAGLWNGAASQAEEPNGIASLGTWLRLYKELGVLPRFRQPMYMAIT